MNTLQDKMVPLHVRWKDLTKSGFEEARIINGNRLQLEGNEIEYIPSNVKIKNFYRYEGMSDPEDNSILYVLETYDGHNAIVIDGYGISADSNVSRFIKSIDEIEKKNL